MRVYRIPVFWQEFGTMHIEANSIEEAMRLADDYPLPDGEYSDGSFEVEYEIAYEFLKEDYPDEYSKEDSEEGFDH